MPLFRAFVENRYLTIVKLLRYRISSIKRRGALKIFEVLGAALFRGRRLLEGGALFKVFISYFLKTQEIKQNVFVSIVSAMQWYPYFVYILCVRGERGKHSKRKHQEELMKKKIKYSYLELDVEEFVNKKTIEFK